MKKRILANKKIILNILGVFFILWGILAVTNAIFQSQENNASILWFCYIVLLIIGFGMLFKNDGLLVAQLNIVIIPFLIYFLDFAYRFATGSSLFGITDYFFSDWPIFSKIISIQHFFTIPLTLFALYLIKVKMKYSYLISFFELILVFIVTYVFTDPADNINCVFSSCVPVSLTGLYQLDWFIGMFLVVFVTNEIIVRIPWFRKNKK
ncbi:hypothetical protein J4477_01255 [Candidatus Pacearchaeota archaeon]|nr:hypothetical protein [Candidatus Pacearchaeota archaeon]